MSKRSTANKSQTPKPTAPSTRRTLWREVDVERERNIPRRTLQDWRTRRVGPPYLKLGSCVFYDAAAVDAWIDAQPRGGDLAVSA